MRVLFADGHEHPGRERIQQLVAASSDGGEARLRPEWFAARGCWLMDTVLPARGPGSHRPASAYLSRLCSLPTVMGMWDLGDTIAPGYTSTYARIGRNPRLPGAPPARFYAGGDMPAADMRLNMLFNEPVWMNNEYDLIVCLARECMRGGWTPALWQKLRWFARHAIEVDFIAYSDHEQLHHGSPAHSVRHCMASAYPSHLWSEGLLAYYCLSGDDDALEVAIKMGDFILRTFADPQRRAKLWRFSRELGWALLYLSCVADITRTQRFLDTAWELAEMLIAEPRDDRLTRTMVRYAFGFASIALGVEMLLRLSGDQRLADWLVALADDVRRVSQEDGLVLGGMARNYLNAAYAITADSKYVTAVGPAADVLRAVPEEHPWPHTKQVAMSYRPNCRFLRAAHDCRRAGGDSG